LAIKPTDAPTVFLTGVPIHLCIHTDPCACTGM
jgi:hypothetical protein